MGCAVSKSPFDEYRYSEALKQLELLDPLEEAKPGSTRRAAERDREAREQSRKAASAAAAARPAKRVSPVFRVSRGMETLDGQGMQERGFQTPAGSKGHRSRHKKTAVVEIPRSPRENVMTLGDIESGRFGVEGTRTPHHKHKRMRRSKKAHKNQAQEVPGIVEASYAQYNPRLNAKVREEPMKSQNARASTRSSGATATTTSTGSSGSSGSYSDSSDDSSDDDGKKGPPPGQQATEQASNKRNFVFTQVVMKKCTINQTSLEDSSLNLTDVVEFLDSRERVPGGGSRFHLETDFPCHPHCHCARAHPRQAGPMPLNSHLHIATPYAGTYPGSAVPSGVVGTQCITEAPGTPCLAGHPGAAVDGYLCPYGQPMTPCPVGTPAVGTPYSMDPRCGKPPGFEVCPYGRHVYYRPAPACGEGPYDHYGRGPAWKGCDPNPCGRLGYPNSSRADQEVIIHNPVVPKKQLEGEGLYRNRNGSSIHLGTTPSPSPIPTCTAFYSGMSVPPRNPGYICGPGALGDDCLTSMGQGLSPCQTTYTCYDDPNLLTPNCGITPGYVSGGDDPYTCRGAPSIRLYPPVCGDSDGERYTMMGRTAPSAMQSQTRSILSRGTSRTCRGRAGVGFSEDEDWSLSGPVPYRCRYEDYEGCGRSLSRVTSCRGGGSRFCVPPSASQSHPSQRLPCGRGYISWDEGESPCRYDASDYDQPCRGPSRSGSVPPIRCRAKRAEYRGRCRRFDADDERSWLSCDFPPPYDDGYRSCSEPCFGAARRWNSPSPNVAAYRRGPSPGRYGARGFPPPPPHHYPSAPCAPWGGRGRRWRSASSPGRPFSPRGRGRSRRRSCSPGRRCRSMSRPCTSSSRGRSAYGSYRPRSRSLPRGGDEGDWDPGGYGFDVEEGYYEGRGRRKGRGRHAHYSCPFNGESYWRPGGGGYCFPCDDEEFPCDPGCDPGLCMDSEDESSYDNDPCGRWGTPDGEQRVRLILCNCQHHCHAQHMCPNGTPMTCGHHSCSTRPRSPLYPPSAFPLIDPSSPPQVRYFTPSSYRQAMSEKRLSPTGYRPSATEGRLSSPRATATEGRLSSPRATATGNQPLPEKTSPKKSDESDESDESDSSDSGEDATTTSFTL